MKYVMEALRQKEVQEKLPVIRMEIDYELMVLYEALQEEDIVLINKTKDRLESLRLEMLSIQEEK